MKINYNENKTRTALFASLAANIFLLAFVLGRFSAMGPAHGGPDPIRGPFAEMNGGPPPFGDHEHPVAGFMPPPPFFGPHDLFSPQEMHADEARIHEKFEKADILRKAFADQLEAGPVSKEDVLKHFADVDGIMDNVKSEMQDKAAAKISEMSPEQRHKFAQSLIRRDYEQDHDRGPRPEISHDQ